MATSPSLADLAPYALTVGDTKAFVTKMNGLIGAFGDWRTALNLWSAQFGSAATANLVLSLTDATPNYVLVNGSHGIGAISTAAVNDVNEDPASAPTGIRRAASTALNLPATNAMVLTQKKYNGAAQFSELSTISSAVVREWVQSYSNSRSPWYERWNSYSLPATTFGKSLLNASDASAALSIIGGPSAGIFTPTLGATTTDGSHTYASQVGLYWKVGNRVDFFIYLDIAAGFIDAAISGALLLKGLPYTAISGAGRFSCVSVGDNRVVWASDAKQINARISGATNYVGLQFGRSAAAPISIANTHLDTAFRMAVSGFYYIA